MSGESGATAVAKEKVTRKAWMILAAMALGAIVAQMFSNAINPAMQEMKNDLDLSLVTMSWISSAYSLAFGVFLVAGGRLGDLIGEVKIIIIGLSVFLGGLVISALAVGGLMLISGRLIQGLGIGLSAPATLSIVVNSFPASRRGFGVGIWGGAHGFGLLLGPLIGGFLTQYVSWRWIFWIAVPITVIVIFVTIGATRGYHSLKVQGRYDFVGLLIGGAAIGLVTYGLGNAGVGWGAPGTWVPLAIGMIAFVVFFLFERKIQDPLVDFGLWRERLFSGGFFAQALVGFVYIPVMVFAGLYLQNVLDLSPATVGLIIPVMPLFAMIFSPIGGRAADRFGYGIPLTILLLWQFVVLILIGRFTPGTPLVLIIVCLGLLGGAVGSSLSVCNAAGMAAVDAKHAGMGSGLLQASFNIPAALGVALISSLVGTLTTASTVRKFADPTIAEVARQYSEAFEAGAASDATATIAALPASVGQSIIDAWQSAYASSIGLGMTMLGFFALGGAVMVWFVIGKRRHPDHITPIETVSV